MAGWLAPILDGLRQLTEHYGASVVLSTATQPAFDLVDEFRDIPAREIVPGHTRHFEALKRVEYDFSRTNEPSEWSDVAEWMREQRSALAIVNTKRHATELLDALGDPDALHLSTLLCRAHRAEVLDEITSQCGTWTLGLALAVKSRQCPAWLARGVGSVASSAQKKGIRHDPRLRTTHRLVPLDQLFCRSDACAGGPRRPPRGGRD